MPVSPAASGASKKQSPLLTTTLRALLDDRRSEGSYLALHEAIAIAVPLCLDLKERHERGERLYVHPSSVGRGTTELATVLPRASLVPTQPRDRACIAPELQGTLEPGTQRASVFALGAMLYEMLTAYSVGPAMRRPREVNPQLPESIEVLLSKALVSDPLHRPDDLGALASALHQLAPAESISPPAADPRALDVTDEHEVDVRMSLLPPQELLSASMLPIAVSDLPESVRGPAAKMPVIPGLPPVRSAQPSSSGAASGPGLPGPGVPMPPSVSRDPAVRLLHLKARLEADPRPRYTVHKDRMDHGPFTAVELLQQIASNRFRDEDGIRDELSGQDRPIKEWEEFAPFAEQAKLAREIVAEKKEVSAAIEAEKSSGIAKVVIAGSVVAALVIGVGAWFFTTRGSRSDNVDIANDPGALDISIDGGARVTMKRGAAAGGAGAKAPSGYAPSGQSYEAALASNKEELTIGAKAGPDLTDAQLAGPLRNSAFISACGAPNDMHVTVRVAVKNGRAVGVSVSTDPPNGGVASCIDRSVRGLSWPANPKMDSFTTRY